MQRTNLYVEEYLTWLRGEHVDEVNEWTKDAQTKLLYIVLF